MSRADRRWSSFRLSRRVLIILAAGSIAVAAGLVFANSLRGTWGLDDYSSILENKKVQMRTFSFDRLWEGATSPPEAERWVTNATFTLNFYLHRKNPKGYKLINLFVHVLTAMGLFFFLYLFLRALFRARWNRGEGADGGEQHPERRALEVAWMAAFLWSIHPILTQTVNYVVQRSVLLSGMFYVWGLWSYMEGRAREEGGARWGFFALTGVLYVLSICSKEVGATLVLALFLMEWLIPDWDDGKRRNMKVFGGGLALVFLIVSFYLIGGIEGIRSRVHATFTGEEFNNRRFTAGQRVMTEWRVVMFYLSLVFYPGLNRLNLEHEIDLSTGLLSPPSTLTSLICILALLIVAFLLRRKRPVVAFGIFWFFLHLAITSTVLNLELIFEHRVYLASAGPVLAVVLLFTQYLPGGFRVRLAWVILAGGLLGWGTVQRNRVWYDQVRLYRDAVEKAPTKPRNQGNLGVAYYRHGRRLLEEGAEPRRVLPLFLKAVHLHVKTLKMGRDQDRPIDTVFARNLDDLLVRLTNLWSGMDRRMHSPELTRKIVDAYDSALFEVRAVVLERREVFLERLFWLRITLMEMYAYAGATEKHRRARRKLTQLIRHLPERARRSVEYIKEPDLRRRMKKLIDRTLERKDQ